jgi:hypothetical protein
MNSASVQDVIMFFAMTGVFTTTLGLVTWLKNKQSIGIHRDRVLLSLDERDQWENIVNSLNAK